MRKALLVGINTYERAEDLTSPVADAGGLEPLLSRNADESLNYDCRVMLDRNAAGKPITKADLTGACKELFAGSRDEVLFYFSGHGLMSELGGYLCTSEASKNDWGVSMQDILSMAGGSPAQDILIVLDCCHAGNFGHPPLINHGRGADPLALIRENMTIIAASREEQVAVEAGGHGLFTAALIDALKGGAADHMGWITAPAIYAYVSRRFGAWDQRPVYKSSTTDVSVVRQCAPLIDRLQLRRLPDLFPNQDHQYRLDPEYEPEDEFGNVKQPVNEAKREIARLFKAYRDTGLLRASDPDEQLYWTARHGNTVELTPRGREYWWLVVNKKI
jgi:hypothetical protein